MTTQTLEQTQTTTERLAEAKEALRHLTERKALLPGQYRQAVARGEATTMATLRADLEGIDVQIQLAAIAVADAEIALLDEQDAELGPRMTACGPRIVEAQQEITRARQALHAAELQHRIALGALRTEELRRDDLRRQRQEAVQRRHALIQAANAGIAG